MTKEKLDRIKYFARMRNELESQDISTVLELLNYVEDLQEVLKPFAAIYGHYLNNALDEYRPEWERYENKDLDNSELYCGRGGKRLMTLGDAKKAYDVI